MADKIKAIKIKQINGTYSEEIPISVNVQNVQWDENNHTLLDALGSVDISSSGKGNLQHQIDELDGDKISTNEFNSRLNDFLKDQISADTTDWLDDNVNPVGSAVIVDKTLTIEGAAADALAVKTELNKKANASNTYTKAEVNAAIDAKKIEVDDTLSITGTAADAKAVGNELTAVKADLDAQVESINESLKKISVKKGDICYGAFNILIDERKLVVEKNVAISLNGELAYVQIPKDTYALFSSETAYLYYYHHVYVKRSTKELILFVPDSHASGSLDVKADMDTNPENYIYLFSAKCDVNIERTRYIGIDLNSDYYLIDGEKAKAISGPMTDFQIFKRDKRITPYILNIDFKSRYCFKVNQFVIPKEDGTGFITAGIPLGYDVDWSEQSNPDFIKILLMNDETKELEVIDTRQVEPSFFSTHSYVGLVYGGSIFDIPVSFSTISGGGSTPIKHYGLKNGFYASHIRTYAGSYKIPKKVGVIGDSLSVGYMKDPSGVVYDRMLKYSWPKVVMADSGNPWLNMGKSGQNVLTWCSHQTYGKVQLEAAGNKCQMYVIGLGVNDSSDSTRGIPLGSPNDISNNPDNVATTYYGGYARIIQLIRRVNQDAIIICLTNPCANTKGETYNEAIRYIVNTYYSDDTKIMMIDMYNKHRFIFTDTQSVLYQDRTRPVAGGHLTANGYRMVASLMEYVIDDLAMDKPNVFETIPFIDYDTGDPTDNTMVE